MTRIVLVVLATILPFAAGAAPLYPYTVQSLGTVEPADGEPRTIAINEWGSILSGTAPAPGEPLREVFLQRRNSPRATLALPQGADRVIDPVLNYNHWVVAGAGGASPDTIRPVAWSPLSNMVPRYILPEGMSGRATAISSGNEVVGYATGAAGPMPRSGFLWTASINRVTYLPDVPGGAGRVTPTGVTNGNVVGTADVGGGSHAFMWHPAQGIRDLGDLPSGAEAATALAANNWGDVVGYGATGEGLRPFFWSEQTGMINLGAIPGHAADTVARGVNDNDWVVGDTLAPPAQRRAFLWSAEHGMHDLNDLLAPAYRDWLVTGASEIDKDGFIRAQATRDGVAHFVRLFPVPEPTALLLCPFAALFLRRPQKPSNQTPQGHGNGTTSCPAPRKM